MQKQSDDNAVMRTKSNIKLENIKNETLKGNQFKNLQSPGPCQTLES